MKHAIIHEPHTTLRASAEPVVFPLADKKYLDQVLIAMKTALYESGDGVALAAPQIDISLQIFMVAGFVYDAINKYTGENRSPDRVYINPEIIKTGKIRKKFPGEGCLSVRHIYGTTKRYQSVTVRAYDEHGREFTETGSGLLAQIFQHEIDHLHGILFIDHAHDIKEMTEAEKHQHSLEIVHVIEQRKKLNQS